jgi:hypothetical protein
MNVYDVELYIRAREIPCPRAKYVHSEEHASSSAYMHFALHGFQLV